MTMIFKDHAEEPRDIEARLSRLSVRVVGCALALSAGTAAGAGLTDASGGARPFPIPAVVPRAPAAAAALRH
jgi:hypothetical protein